MMRIVLCILVLAFPAAILGQQESQEAFDARIAKAIAAAKAYPIKVSGVDPLTPEQMEIMKDLPPIGPWQIRIPVGSRVKAAETFAFHQWGRIPDAAAQPGGPWPPELEFPAGIDPQPYERALYTQEIAITTGTDGIDRDSITRVPRSFLELKWRYSGGLDPKVDWTSTLYKSKNLKAKHWIGDIVVKNGINKVSYDNGRTWFPTAYETTQKHRGHRVEFADGTRFFDVLSTPKGVFEIRERRKVRGKWDYIVHQEFPERAPAGYAGSMKLKDCRTCHVEAGTGSYGAGLVPGGDETLSLPLAGLE